MLVSVILANLTHRNKRKKVCYVPELCVVYAGFLPGNTYVLCWYKYMLMFIVASVVNMPMIAIMPLMWRSKSDIKQRLKQHNTTNSTSTAVLCHQHDNHQYQQRRNKWKNVIIDNIIFVVSISVENSYRAET